MEDVVVELHFLDGSVARVPWDVVQQGWLGWLSGEWVLDPLTAAGIALSRPDPDDGGLVADLRAECRSRLGLEGDA